MRKGTCSKARLTLKRCAQVQRQQRSMKRANRLSLRGRAW